MLLNLAPTDWPNNQALSSDKPSPWLSLTQDSLLSGSSWWYRGQVQGQVQGQGCELLQILLNDSKPCPLGHLWQHTTWLCTPPGLRACAGKLRPTPTLTTHSSGHTPHHKGHLSLLHPIISHPPFAQCPPRTPQTPTHSHRVNGYRPSLCHHLQALCVKGHVGSSAELPGQPLPFLECSPILLGCPSTWPQGLGTVTWTRLR